MVQRALTSLWLISLNLPLSSSALNGPRDYIRTSQLIQDNPPKSADLKPNSTCKVPARQSIDCVRSNNRAMEARILPTIPGSALCVQHQSSTSPLWEYRGPRLQRNPHRGDARLEPEDQMNSPRKWLQGAKDGERAQD